MEVLVTARNEYQKQLCNIMTPHMIIAFQDMFEEAGKMSKGKNTLKQFQSLLRDVKNWNSNIVRQHVDSVCNSCSWYNDLLAAVFVSAVKILSSVRLTAERKKLNIKIPSNETFIQGCYENAARNLYSDPYIFTESMNEFDRDNTLAKRFNECVELTIDNMMPVQEILKTNIGDRVPGEVDIHTGPEEEIGGEDSDPEVEEEEEGGGGDMMNETEEETVTVPAPVPQPGLEAETGPQQPEEEVKDISLEKPATNDDDDEEGVLFPGAPER